jgi:large subunit ribosomal protein L30
VPSPRLKIVLTRSIIGLSPKQEATVKALGLRRSRQQVVQDDNATVRGMIARVPHVLRVTHEA